MGDSEGFEEELGGLGGGEGGVRREGFAGGDAADGEAAGEGASGEGVEDAREGDDFGGAGDVSEAGSKYGFFDLAEADFGGE